MILEHVINFGLVISVTIGPVEMNYHFIHHGPRVFISEALCQLII